MIIFRAIGIFLVFFFAGVPYYKLAAYHFKNKWLFGILGMATYYGGIFIGTFVFGMAVPGITRLLLGLLGTVCGVICCFALYRVLRSKWEADENNNSGIDDDSSILDSNIGTNR